MDVAIAKAWVLRRGQLDEVNLFDGKHVPALVYEGQSSTEHLDDDVIYPPDTPALYIGRYIIVSFSCICVISFKIFIMHCTGV